LHTKERVQPRPATAQARARNPDAAQRMEGVASLEAGPTRYGAGTQAQPELWAPAQLERERRQPGRNWGKTSPLRIPPHAGPAGERQDPPRIGPSQNWSKPAQPKAEQGSPGGPLLSRPSQDGLARWRTGPAGIRPPLAQELDIPARKGRIRCLPAHEREFQPG
jgi:hypothetical protein